MLGRLRAAIAALDQRAASEPGLERYRVPGDPSALDRVPDGWFVSDAIASIATDGGWWPGRWDFPDVDDLVPLILTGAESAPPDAQVRWICVGTVWERDAFWTAAMREPTESSPLFGFSSQALWSSMVFPDEAAMLEAFTIAYDELGIDEHGEVHPFFVEWVTRPPNQHDPEGAPRAHRRIVELAATWRTDHPCWVPGEMPRMCTQPRVDDWSAETVATILGVGR